MRYISNLNNKTVKELEKIVKNGSSLQLRQRAKSILLSNEGITVKEICKIFNKSTRTVYRWFDRFKEEQIENLSDEIDKLKGEISFKISSIFLSLKFAIDK